MRTSLSRLALAGLLVATVVAGCSAETEPATPFGDGAALLRGIDRWDAGDGPGEIWFEYRKVGTTPWSEVGRQSYPDLQNSGSRTVEQPVGGLDPQTQYEFRRCGNGDKDAPNATVCWDSQSNLNGTNYDRFTTAAVPEMQATSAAAFIDSLGINTRTTFVGTPSSNYPQVEQALRHLGIWNIRDGFHHHLSSPGSQHDFFRSLAFHGFQGTIGGWDLENEAGDQSCTGLHGNNKSVDAKLPFFKNDPSLRAFVDAFDSVNEPDFYTAFPGWQQCMRDFQRYLYEQVNNDPNLAPIPVLGPSFATCCAHNEVGSLEPWLDYGNIHPYPGGANPPGRLGFEQNLDKCHVTSGPKPCRITEVGYHRAIHSGSPHQGVSEEGRGIYTTRMVLEFFRRGISRTDLYTLVAQHCDATNEFSTSSFGFYDCNWNPRIVAHHVHNLTKILGSGPDKPAPVPNPAPFRLRIGEAGDDMRHLLMRHANGTLSLAIWRDVSVWNADTNQDLSPAPDPMEVVLNVPAAQVQRYQPNQNEAVHQTWTNQRKILVSVDGTVTVLRITP